MSVSSPDPSTKPLLSDGAYNFLVAVSAFLPLLSTLYYALAQIWHFPNVEEIVGSIAAVNTFLIGFAAYSKKSYNKSEAKYTGDLNIIDTGDNMTRGVSLRLNSAVNTFENDREVTFKVVKVD